MNNIGVLPSLGGGQWNAFVLRESRAHLWEGTVVPEITLVREAVADETKLALLDILLDWVEKVLLQSIRRCILSFDGSRKVYLGDLFWN